MRKLVVLALMSALLGASAKNAVAEPPGNPRPRLYAVILEVVASRDGSLENVRVSKVIDPSTGSNEPVDVPVPETYLRDARLKIAARRHLPEIENGRPKPYFTYFYFDPAQPSTALDELPG